MNLFARARQGLNLSPGERAFLKCLKAIVYAVLAFLLGGQGLAVLSAIQQPHANVGAILYDNLVTPVLMIVLLTLEKSFTAQGDKPLADALGAVVKDLPQAPQAASPSPAPTPTPVLPGVTVPLPPTANTAPASTTVTAPLAPPAPTDALSAT